MADVGFMLLFLFLCCTVVRLLPMVQDLVRAGTCDITRFTTRSIVGRHARGLLTDIREMCIFVTYTVLICALVVGLPSYVSNILEHGQSMRSLNAYARGHLADTIEYFCEFLALFGAWRTYKIVMTATVYCVLVPAACVAEVLGVAMGVLGNYSSTSNSSFTNTNNTNNTAGFSTKCRFYTGLVLFYILFICVCISSDILLTQSTGNTNTVTNTISDTNTNSVYSVALYIQIFVCGGIGVVLLLSTLVFISSGKPPSNTTASTSANTDNTTANTSANNTNGTATATGTSDSPTNTPTILSNTNRYWSSAPTLSPTNFLPSTASWSQYLALLTPLCEMLYSCAIIVYFYWNNTNIVSDGTDGTDFLSTSVGTNSMIITQLLGWNSGTSGYELSLAMGLAMGLLSGMLISIPLAISNGSASTSTEYLLVHFVG